MSLEHKVFILDSESFYHELKPLIEQCLRSSNVDEIREFILMNKSSLSDPYEGEQLADDWEDMIEDKDVHQYGDFALTKYYSPIFEMGLGTDWENIKKLFDGIQEQSFSPILGVPLGIEGEYFDPGKMGSYFQNSSEVKESLSILNMIEESVPSDLIENYYEFKKILELAVKENKGLYVTF